ncbi:MAG: LD-carboxypeptidase [Pirellulales bacterium]
MRPALPAIALLMVSTSFSCAETPTKPAALRAGDTIMLVAPAGELDRERIERARQRLEAMGFRVIVPETLFRRRGYLAGTDQQRANELMAAFQNPEVKAIFPGTGGYGTTRMLELLDYDSIQAHPKILIGFSDITGLHLALAKKCNLITFHSPVAQHGLGSPDGLSEFSAKYFWRCLLADENDGDVGFEYEPPEGAPLQSLRGGKARGRLLGGNLSLVAATMGTPYEIETDGRVLFFEDVNEAPYRIDRMFSQLKLAGKLKTPAAVILGQFTKAEPDEGDSSLTVDEVFADYFADAEYPVVKNFPAGHAPNNATVPMGALFEVDGDKPSVRLLENPVR